MELWFLLVFCTIVFVAAVVQGISGFAFVMVVLMVLPYYFGYTQALALSSLIYVVILYYNSYIYRKYIEWKWVPCWVIVFIITDTIGVLVLKNVGDHPAWYALMGIAFIVMSLYLLWGQQKISFRPTLKKMMLFSGLCGIVTGFFAVGGPIMATFFLVAINGKEKYLGTTQIIGVFTMTIDVFARAISGMYTIHLVKFACVGWIVAIVGILVAKVLVGHLNEIIMKKCVCAVMIFSGLTMLV